MSGLWPDACSGGHSLHVTQIGQSRYRMIVGLPLSVRSLDHQEDGSPQRQHEWSRSAGRILDWHFDPPTETMGVPCFAGHLLLVGRLKGPHSCSWVTCP
ncbi:Hypothetical predicted protein, partial [Pelobates cultripes]